jgi:hypothetical protein
MFEKAPSYYTLKSLVEIVNHNRTQTEDGNWVPARPLGYFSFRYRLWCAWQVFTGNCDVLKWPADQ